MRILRQYRLWARKPPLRAIARRSGVATSTICSALNGAALPRLEVVRGIVIGCGACEEDQRRFTTAWRAIRLAARDEL